MGLANGEKTGGSEQKIGSFLQRSTTTTTTASPFYDEKQALRISEEGESGESRQPAGTSDNMSPLRHLLLTLFLFALFTITIVSASTNNSPLSPDNTKNSNPSCPKESPKFQDLLSSVSASSLHEILHSCVKEKYQHGVYPEDRTAMEAVHQQDATAASSLIELAKRQTSGNTTNAGTAMSTVVQTSGETTISVVSTPTSSTEESTTQQQTTQQQQSVSQTQQQQTTASPTTAVVVGSTTQTSTSMVASSTNAVRQSGTSGSVGAGIGSSSMLNAGTATSSSTTNPPTTAAPSQTTQSSLTTRTVYTTTYPDGNHSTVTAVTVVPADQAIGTTSAGAESTSTHTANVSLQTNAASSLKNFAGILAGLVGGFVMILVGVL